MITFCSGMPGDGKSYFIMTEIERELVETDRLIVTNVELNIGNVAEYLHKHYGKTFDLHSRYFYLDPIKSKKFWLHRGTYTLLEEERDGEKTPRCNFLTLDTEQPGVCYVIDELHEHFNARNWAKTGADALTYCSQHRKLGDSVFFISQRAKQVDSQLRSLSGAYIYMRNLNNRTLKVGPMVFNFGKSLIARCYPEEWQKGGAEPPQMWSKSLKVDPEGHGNWYDTAAGVGVKGGKADTVNNRKKGTSWIVLFPLLLLFGALFWIVPKALSLGAEKMLSSRYDSETEGTLANKALSNGSTNAFDPPEIKQPPPLQLQTDTDTAQVPLDLSDPQAFVIQRNGFVVLTLKDGKQLTSADGIELLGRNGYRYEGRVYPLP